ncbi:MULTISPECIES: type III pantothenate kinase [Marinomonas]|uniref:type III pantothenate kinase n=1 Tax=Marinomonas TaxID=28253 RepID=UPI001055BE82|nr:type III pantothenate kinase [Marinomonas flavescens]
MSVVDRVLIVDVGNTSIKYTAFEGDLVLWQVRDDEMISKNDFLPDAIYFASVRSEEENQASLLNLRRGYPLSEVVELKSEAEICGVRSAYHEPHRLGVDRWLTVIASYHLFGGDVVIVDAGTAIKVDMVNSVGQHLGGYITPGLAMMEKSLLSNTARIRYENAEKLECVGLPNSTARAVSEGCNEMALGFLERLYKGYKHFTWVVTGGDAQLLLSALRIDAKQELYLVAKGAKLVGDEYLRGRL